MKKMKPLVFAILIIGFTACYSNELFDLKDDLASDEVILFAYDVGGYGTYQCNPNKGQKILIDWSKSLKKAALASWPEPDNYIDLTFKNGHHYKIKTFIGTDKLNYSVIYVKGVYVGNQLMLDSICSGLRT